VCVFVLCVFVLCVCMCDVVRLLMFFAPLHYFVCV